MDIVKEHFPNCVRPSSHVDWLDLLRKSLFITAEVQQIKTLSDGLLRTIARFPERFKTS